MKKIVSITSLSFILTVSAQECWGASDTTSTDGLRYRGNLTASGGPQEDDKKDVGSQAEPVETATTTGWGFWPFASQTQEPASAKVEQTNTGGSIWNLFGWLGGAPAPAPVIEKSVWNLWGLLGGSAPAEPGDAPTAAVSARRVRRSHTLSMADVPPAQEGEAPAGGISTRTIGRSRILSDALPSAEHPVQGGSVLDLVGFGWLLGTTAPAAPTTSAAAEQPAASPDVTGGQEDSTGRSAEASSPLPAGKSETAPQVLAAESAASQEASIWSVPYWIYSAGPPAVTKVVGLPAGPAEVVSTEPNGHEGKELSLMGASSSAAALTVAPAPADSTASPLVLAAPTNPSAAAGGEEVSTEEEAKKPFDEAGTTV